MSEINKVVKHIEGDVDRVSDLLTHIKSHIKKARELYESGTIKELSEIGEHLLQIDAKVHELYHHIVRKEISYRAEDDITIIKKE
jgi:aspartyl aminopeptidase